MTDIHFPKLAIALHNLSFALNYLNITTFSLHDLNLVVAHVACFFILIPIEPSLPRQAHKVRR